MWFNHDHSKWEEFQNRYFIELSNQKEAITELLSVLSSSRVIFLFASKEREYNNAVALKKYCELNG